MSEVQLPIVTYVTATYVEGKHVGTLMGEPLYEHTVSVTLYANDIQIGEPEVVVKRGGDGGLGGVRCVRRALTNRAGGTPLPADRRVIPTQVDCRMPVRWSLIRDWSIRADSGFMGAFHVRDWDAQAGADMRVLGGVQQVLQVRRPLGAWKDVEQSMARVRNTPIVFNNH